MVNKKREVLKKIFAGKADINELYKLTVSNNLCITFYDYGFNIKNSIDEIIDNEVPVHKPSFTILMLKSKHATQIRFENFTEYKEFHQAKGTYPESNGIDFYLKNYRDNVFNGLSWKREADKILYWNKDKEEIVTLLSKM